MEGSYIYKKEVDWSLLVDGFTIPLENQVIFAQNMGGFLKRGEKKDIIIFLQGQSYKARIVNVNFDHSKYKRKDVYQVRYSRGSELAVALQNFFIKSYNYIIRERGLRGKVGGPIIKVPEGMKEYLVLYTTEYADTYIAEVITSDEMQLAQQVIPFQDEYVFENSVNYNVCDETASILMDERLVKIRKLNRAIGENLKLIYDYRCQICGQFIGETYGTQVAEAHHIDPYVKSMNNDASNQLIVCPNHHRIIHHVNPIFDRKEKVYLYENGFKEGLSLNYHLK